MKKENKMSNKIWPTILDARKVEKQQQTNNVVQTRYQRELQKQDDEYKEYFKKFNGIHAFEVNRWVYSHAARVKNLTICRNFRIKFSVILIIW